MAALNPSKMLSVLVLMTAAILALQCIMLLRSLGAIAVSGLGMISAGVVSAVVMQMVALSLVLVATALLSIKPGPLNSGRLKVLAPLPLVLGAVLAVEGLAAINLSGLITSGLAPSIAVLTGLQLFCLGILAVSSFIVGRENAYLGWRIPNYAVLLFLILILPAAFLIA